MKSKPMDESKVDVLHYRKAKAKDGPSPEAILRELTSLAGDKTFPDNPDGERDKDLNSFRAFQLAGQLIGPLLQWAINHETGKIIKGHKSHVPVALHRINNKRLFDETMQLNREANSHVNEKAGGAYSSDDPVINRRSTAKVLELLARAMNFRAGVLVGIALEALDSGQTLPETEPAKNSRQGKPFLLDRARLSAIEHVEFRHATGMLKHEAIKIVAKAFRVGEDVIPQWQKSSATRLPSVNPASVVDYADRAKRVGAVLVALDDRTKRASIPVYSPPINWDDLAMRDKLRGFADYFSDKNLKSVGKKYQALLRP